MADPRFVKGRPTNVEHNLLIKPDHIEIGTTFITGKNYSRPIGKRLIGNGMRPEWLPLDPPPVILITLSNIK